jgi:hypothetical protein
VQPTPLLAAGISLGQTSQTPAISQRQAITLANQLEPQIASQAKGISAKFVLLNYPVTTTPATHANFDNTPVWVVWYQRIPLAPGDATSAHSSHDCYVFLDATTGKEVLKVWL